MLTSAIHILHRLPILWIGAIITGFNLTFFLALPIVVRRFARIKLNENLVKGADDAFKIIVSLTMALIAFALVQVESLHRNVGDLVAREGAVLFKFDSSLEDFEPAQADEIKQRLRAYVASVIKSEWPGLGEGRRSAETSAKLAELSAAVDAVNAEGAKQLVALGEAKGQLSQIKDVREARLASAHVNLSPYFGYAIIFALLLLAVLGWFQSPIEKMVPYLGGLTLGLSILLTLVVASSGIFEGEGRVDPTEIKRTLALIQPDPAAVPRTTVAH